MIFQDRRRREGDLADVAEVTLGPGFDARLAQPAGAAAAAVALAALVAAGNRRRGHGRRRRGRSVAAAVDLPRRLVMLVWNAQ